MGRPVYYRYEVESCWAGDKAFQHSHFAESLEKIHKGIASNDKRILWRILDRETEEVSVVSRPRFRVPQNPPGWVEPV